MPSIICSATVYRLSDRLFFIQLRLTIKLIPQRLGIVPFFLLLVVGNLGSRKSANLFGHDWHFWLWQR
jgi:hypothetical protein